MSLLEAFLMVTAFAYLACVFFTLVGKPPLFEIDDYQQAVFYFLAFFVIWIVAAPPFSISWPPQVYSLLGALYAFAAIGSFIGYPQRWMAYWRKNPEDGSDSGQIGMAFWDLAISISFLYLSLA
jgi:hypothetical protein